MIDLPVLAAAQPVEAAERAFASMAQTKGQWTAFRAFAAPNAVMVFNRPQPAAPFLKGRKNPPLSVRWWPDRTVTSCDGTLAFSTGPYRQPDGAGGRFLTIWKMQPDGQWKWVYDSGTKEAVTADPPARVDAQTATCWQKDEILIDERYAGGGESRDGSLRWRLHGTGPNPLPANARGTYRLIVEFRTPSGWTTAADLVVDN